MMDDTNHTEEQLLRELEAQRQQICELQIHCDKPEMRCCGILDSIDSGVGVYEVVEGGKDVLFKDINAAGERIGQVRKEDIVGRSLLAIFPMAREDGTFDVICDVWKTGQPRTMPAHLYDDGRITVWTEAHLFKLPSGEIVHVANEVTRFMMAQQAFEESEEKYRVLVESASEAITVFDAHGTIKFANARVNEHFGGGPDELIGKTMRQLFSEPVASLQMGYVEQVIETGMGTTAAYSMKIQGQDKWFEATLVPIRSGRGRVLDVMVIARDVTELKKTRDELGAFHQQMMQTERLASTGTLSAMVAHELNQPLTVIKLSVQNVLSALNANQPAETLFEDLNECLKGVENAAERVGQFRSFARGVLKREKSFVAVRPLIDKTLRLVEEGCKRARLAITVDGFEGLPPLHACAQDLEQLFFILVENSLQASDRKSDHHLTITGSSRGNCIEVRLADDCGGIAPENVNEIFKLFFTTKSRNQGTGLGLCIADRIITEMGGKITVNNHPGQGVAFCVSLPIESDWRLAGHD
ncbi:MAG: PAS domain-containing protein [Phycisphaeraceae bacterium]|nr:PAS domain-containing protein [Phycisphaeraceae bacterium]